MVEKKKGSSSKAKQLVSGQKTLFDLFPRRLDPPKETKDLQRRAEHPRIDGDSGSSIGLPQASSSKITLDIYVNNGQHDHSTPLVKQPHPLFENQPVSQPNSVPAQPISPIDEIIEIVDDEPTATDVPKSIPPSTSNPSSEASPSQSSISSADAGTRRDPIVLHSSPLKPTAARRNLSKMTYSIFTPRVTKSPAPPNNTSKAAKILEVPYPDQNFQHVRGPQGSFPSPPISFRLRDNAQRTRTPENALAKSSWSNSIHNEDIAQSSRKLLYLLPFSGPSDRKTYLESIPQEHKYFHPAVARLVDSSDAASPSSQMLWTDRWRPTRAQEVLGNEKTSLFLRDWLRALELQVERSSPAATTQDSKLRTNGYGKSKVKEDGKSAKRPRIVRAVEKKKRRKKQRMNSEDEEDSWIVNSDGNSEDEVSQTESDDDHEADFQQVTRSRLYRRDDTSNDTFPPLAKPPAEHTFDRLTNTILLTGPPGCGKTAAVYACAEELGWEVFEVYPGIGKRNGANLDHLVGEVGRNHLVRKTQHRGGEMKTSSKDKGVFTAFLGKGKGKDKEILSGGGTGADGKVADILVEEGPASSGDFGFVAALDTKSGDHQKPIKITPVVRQSVILLEEVDILFKEDTSFWPAVSKFIRNCRRPVVCTCNDPSLIPIDDLPLQTTLTFKPCPPPVATSYLQSLCCAEGHVLEPESIARLYESAYDLNSIDFPDMPTNLMTAGLPTPDLRRAIHCLQLWGPIKNHTPRPESFRGLDRCQDSFEGLDWDLRIKTTPSKDVPCPEPQEQTRALHRSELYHADLMSFADSHLTRSPLDTPDALVLNSYEPSANDEIGHTILFNATKASVRNDVHFGLYDRDELIASTAIRFSRENLQAKTPRGSTSIMTTDAFRTRALFRARVDYQIQMIGVLRNVLPFSVPFTSCPAVHVDYEPYVRHIVAIDDSQELLLNGGRSGRVTRNSQRYVRTITLSTEERNALRITALGANSLDSDVLPTDPGMDVE